AGLGAGGEEQLEKSDGRLAERERRRDTAAVRQPVGGDGADGSAILERRGGELGRIAEAGLRIEAVGADELERVALAPLPEQRDRSADDAGREPDDLGRGRGLVQRRGEGLAGKVERLAGGGHVGGRGCEGAQDESHVTGGEIGGELLRGRERAVAIQL